MNKINYNLYLKIYLTALFLFAVYFFFQKYNNLVEWTISEWLINYQGGFTRRGFIGEIVFQFSKLLTLTIRETILLFQIISYSIFFYLIFQIIKNTNKHLLLIFAVFSPLFIIYPISEVEVLGRKEIFTFIAFLLTIKIFSLNNIRNKHYIYFSIILMISCLIWEGIIIYLSYFIFILFLKNNFILNKIFLTRLILCMLPIFISLYFIIFFRLDDNGLKTMCESINECYGAISYLNKDLSSNIGEVVSKFKFSFLIRYLLIFFVGFFPLIILVLNSNFDTKIRFKYKYSFQILFLILLLPTLIFYYIAQDWGRWVCISYTLSLLTYLYCLKNNLIILNTGKIDFAILKKKSIVILLFIIFGFGWGPKTLINEDISSVPIYRKSVSVIKNVFF